MGKVRHKAYIREVPGSDTAILFIHGILGTPAHFDRLVDAVPGEWSVYNILLAGHGGTVGDFAAATMEQWKGQVHRMVVKLGRQYERIMITAHSMGTLFAISESLDHPKIRALFLLNVPLMVYVHPKIVKISLKIIYGKVSQKDIEAAAVQNAFSITPERHLLKYLRWLPNYISLFKEVRRTRMKIDRIDVPCFVFQSGKDELIPAGAAKYLRHNPRIRCAALRNSGHFYYEARDMAYVVNRFQKLCHLLKIKKI